MSAIPFVTDIEFDYGVMEQVAPGIRRVIANNPGPFTFTGTGTYIIGEGKVAVIDPGPDDPEHIAAILKGLEGEEITHILITHTHMDHSPGAAPLKEKTGAETWGFGPHGGNIEGEKVEEGGDWRFKPDHVTEDGDVIEGAGWTVEAIHTPGHTSNHLCFSYREGKALFSGDHVMGWSTSVISPPDGNMTDYLESLKKLLARDEQTIWPTHGPPIREPGPFIEAFIAHREAREDQIMNCLLSDARYIPAMVKIMYADVPDYLHPAAERSVLAHLEHMIDEGRVVASTPEPTLKSLYTAATG